ncbi:MAG TPA: MFS transporter [Pseudonocardiaceae bacterium]
MRRHAVLVGLAIVLLSANLRPAVASVGPVLPELRAGLRLSGTQTAVLTMLPVLFFGLLAPVAPRLARRIGIEPVLAGALAALAVGLVGRVLAGPSLLFAGTILVGGAIAVANVLLPPLVKRDFPHRTGLMMGIYTTAIAAAAAIAAGVTVPVTDAFGWDWRGALGMWVAPAAIALLVWLPLIRSHTRPPAQPHAGPPLARDPLAWQVTAFFGLQSLQFYVMLGWLPSIYRDHGYRPAAAGFLLSLFGLVQLPVTLLLPRLATRARNQVIHVVLSTAILGVGLVGMLVAPTAAPYLWVVLAGIGCGACFALALALVVLRTGRVAETARLSAMAQTVGYVISAFGPLVFGILHETVGSWTAPVLLLVLLVVPQLWCGVLAGRSRVLADRLTRSDAVRRAGAGVASGG